MIENPQLFWTKDNLRTLRLRMGWSKSDLAHHLQCTSDDIAAWEVGTRRPESSVRSQLEFLLRQAEASSEEVKTTPAAENQCAAKALAQIDFSRVKAELE